MTAGLKRDMAERDLAELGQLQFDAGLFEDALRSWSTAGRAGALRRAARFNVAVCLERLERWIDAAAAFQTLVDEEPEWADARCALGINLLRAGNAAEALEAFDCVLRIDPGYERATSGQVMALYQLGRLVEAERACLARLSRHPDSEEELSNLVALAMDQRSAAALRRYAGRLLALNPQSRQGLEGMATAAFREHDYGRASIYCARLVGAEPASYEGWFDLGVACQELSRLDEAADAYTQAARLRPDAEPPCLNLGMVRQLQGDMAGARREYERAAEVVPGSNRIMVKALIALLP